MGSWWATITEAQGTIISGGLTVLAAVLGVFFGGRIFDGKVKNIETALTATEQAIDGHLNRLTGRLSAFDNNFNDLETKLSTLEEQFSATSESLGQLRGSVGDLQTSANQLTDAEDEAEVIFSRDEVREDWTAIRDLLEQIAADPSIDGRTRAKYARIDRRRYNDLIDRLEWDGNLEKAPKYRQANEIWQQYKNGRREVDPRQGAALHQIRTELLGG